MTMDIDDEIRATLDACEDDLDTQMLTRASEALRDYPCCSAGIVVRLEPDGVWRVRPRGLEFTIGVGNSRRAALVNAVAAAHSSPS